jgi:hypothetical protein
LAIKKVEETVVQEVPEVPEVQEAPEGAVEAVETIEFAHKFLFATYDLGIARVDFVNGSFTTNNQQIINSLRKSPDFGQELIEIGKKV